MATTPTHRLNPRAISDRSLKQRMAALVKRHRKLAEAIARLEDEKRAVDARQSVLNIEWKRRLGEGLRTPVPFAARRRKRAR